MSNSSVTIPDQGPAGTPSFAVLAEGFSVPPATGGASVQQVTITVGPAANGAATNTNWMFSPMLVQLNLNGVSYGTYKVIATPNLLQATLENDGATGNPTPGTPVPAGAGIVPAGVGVTGPVGPTGPTGPTGPSGPVAASVANPAALAALSTTGLLAGSVAYVQSLDSEYRLVPTDTRTPDNVNIIAAAAPAGGNWVGLWVVPQAQSVQNFNVTGLSGNQVVSSTYYLQQYWTMSGTLSANIVLQMPTTAGVLSSLVNMTGVSFGAFTITFQVAGNNWSVVFSASSTSFYAAFTNTGSHIVGGMAIP